MTYGRLWDTLVAPGYTRTDAPEYIVFREEEHDVLIALPIKEPDTNLHFWHHVSSRNNVFGRGVASAEAFERILTKPAMMEAVTKTVKGKASTLTRTGFIRPRKKAWRQWVKLQSGKPKALPLLELHAEKS